MTAALLVKPAIAEFAGAVRDALDDLMPEEVDDLTDGLEADLSEQSAEAPDFEPGDPLAYAAELRAAAGLPPRSSHRQKRGARRSGIGDLMRRARFGLPTEVRKLPLGSRALDFLGAVRPLGWLLRGWALYVIAANVSLAFWGRGLSVIPRSFLGWVLFFAWLIVSIQWGRGRWMLAAWLRGVRTFATVASIVAVPIAFVSLPISVSLANQSYFGATATAELPPGISVDGRQVTNIFAYGPDGQPLTGVQLFDQDGKPLNASSPQQGSYLDSTSDGSNSFDYLLVPSQEVPGRPGWNVFPLDRVDQSDLDVNGVPEQGTVPTPVALPFPSVQPLAGSDSSPSPSPSPTPTTTVP